MGCRSLGRLRLSTAHALAPIGFTDALAAYAGEHHPDQTPGRVVRADRGYVFVLTVDGIVLTRPATRLLKQADEGGMPVAGDWVVLAGEATDPLVEAVLPRTTAIVRRDPSRATRLQVLAANVDVVLITHPIAEEPNLSRVERELSLVWESGARPVVVLTKCDLSVDAVAAREAVEQIAPGVPVHLTSAVTGDGLEDVRPYLEPGITAVLIGPSGAGKSTLINAMTGDDLRATRDVRVSDGRGRHTTVSRELIQLPGGGLVIDTPGLRAVGMWESADGIGLAFSDIAALAGECRFRDCRHEGEPGCAVEAAVEAGDLPLRRLESYRELQAEARHVGEQLDVRARQERKREDKKLAKAIKTFYRDGGKPSR